MIDKTKYIKVDWPEFQIYMEHPYFRERSIFAAEECSYMIPEDLIEEVDSGIYFPKRYENTNLGTIIGYETYILVGEEQFSYGTPKKGNKVLSCLNDPHKWEITTCINDMPILLENGMLEGIDCKIIGYHE